MSWPATETPAEPRGKERERERERERKKISERPK
jgi:hypothetical protein